MKLNIQRFAVTKSTTFAESNISIEDNTSTLKITIQFSPNNDVTFFSSKTLNCTCNGVKQSASVSLSKGGSVKKTFTFNGIKHDTDGTKSVSWNWSCATGTSVLGTISASGTKTLETIPQASEIISVSSGTTPYYPIIVWQPKSIDFKFKVEYKAGNYSVISGLIAPQQTLQYSYSGLLIANSLFSYFPSTSVVTLRATLYTYKSDGTTEVGRSSYDFNVALDSSVKPNLTIKSLNEANDVMIDLNWRDGNNKPIFVQNRSQLGITYSVYPYPTNLPASNVTTTITANGQTFTQTGYNNSNQIDYTITTEKLNTNTTITATAKDTRSRQDTKTQTYSVVPYSNPSITIAQAQRCRQDGTLDDEGTYVKFSFSGSISSCSNHNDSTFIISYKKTTDEYYTSVNLSTAYSINVSNQISSFTISKDYTYDIKFSAVDSFTTTEIVRTLDTGFDLLNFNPSGKAMAIGKVSEAASNENLLEVALPTKFTEYVKDELVVESIRSKNMLDKTTIVAGDITGINSTIRLSSRQALWLKAGTYTLSCNITSPFKYGIQVQSVGIPPLSSYPTYILDSGWKTSSQKTYTFTINTSGWANLMLCKENNATLTVSEVLAFNYQLERNSSATTYYPYQNLEEIKSVKIPQNDFINQLNSGITIMHYNIFKLSNTISGTIVVKTTNVIGNTNVELFNIKEGYRTSTSYYTFCGLGTDDWRVQRIGYFYLGSNGNAIVLDQNNSGVCKYAIINFNYQI